MNPKESEVNLVVAPVYFRLIKFQNTGMQYATSFQSRPKKSLSKNSEFYCRNVETKAQLSTISDRSRSAFHPVVWATEHF
jgi:hypothetical protein